MESEANCKFESNCLMYYPKGYLAEKDNPDAQILYFPLQGYTTKTGENSWGNIAFYLATDSNSNDANTYLCFMGSPNGTARISHRYTYSNIGITVRCIREDY